MSDPDAPCVPSRYRVHRLAEPKPTERGVLYRRGERTYLLAWDEVKCAVAAEVGSSVVFDLAVRVEGPECVVCRIDTVPGELARALARAIRVALGADRCDASLRAVVEDGWPSRSHFDLPTFEEAALEAIRFR